MDTIRVLKPGKYKKVKTKEAGRQCMVCFSTLSIYNPTKKCAMCK